VLQLAYKTETLKKNNFNNKKLKIQKKSKKIPRRYYNGTKQITKKFVLKPIKPLFFVCNWHTLQMKKLFKLNE